MRDTGLKRWWWTHVRRFSKISPRSRLQCKTAMTANGDVPGLYTMINILIRGLIGAGPNSPIDQALLLWFQINRQGTVVVGVVFSHPTVQGRRRQPDRVASLSTSLATFWRIQAQSPQSGKTHCPSSRTGTVPASSRPNRTPPRATGRQTAVFPPPAGKRPNPLQAGDLWVVHADDQSPSIPSYPFRLILHERRIGPDIEENCSIMEWHRP